ncbi:hypothetical protein DFH09DRAFT_1500791 [Mycena vulgaris]|nr:hypothetical protein DFH09DRAFT_1500791 [Mycena vulgaris]
MTYSLSHALLTVLHMSTSSSNFTLIEYYARAAGTLILESGPHPSSAGGASHAFLVAYLSPSETPTPAARAGVRQRVVGRRVQLVQQVQQRVQRNIKQRVGQAEANQAACRARAARARQATHPIVKRPPDTWPDASARGVPGIRRREHGLAEFAHLAEAVDTSLARPLAQKARPFRLRVLRALQLLRCVLPTPASARIPWWTWVALSALEFHCTRQFLHPLRGPVRGWRALTASLSASFHPSSSSIRVLPSFCPPSPVSLSFPPLAPASCSPFS